MKTIKIGDREINRIGLGCMGMSDFYGQADDDRSKKVIQHALDQGIAMFDTADMYGPWKNETLLGDALKGRREQAFIATKFGVVRDQQGAFLGINGRPDYVKKACENSLKRLNIDIIDLYYQHRVDQSVPIEETVGAMADLVQAGKVRQIGLSEAHPDTIRRAHRVHPISALQTEYSLWSRDPEREALDLCRQLGIAFVAYSPLGRGFLSGAIESPETLDAADFRRQAPRFSTGNFDRNLKLVEGLTRIAKHHGCTTAQLALAWVLASAEHTMIIPGTTKLHRIDENLAAQEIKLSDADMRELDALAPLGVAAGERYDARGMSSVNG